MRVSRYGLPEDRSILGAGGTGEKNSNNRSNAAQDHGIREGGCHQWKKVKETRATEGIWLVEELVTVFLNNCTAEEKEIQVSAQ